MKDIPGFEGLYAVTRDGRVWSYPKTANRTAAKYRRGHFVTCFTSGIPPYPRVCLRKGGKKYWKRVHRLVAEMFIPNPENKPEVNHKNAIKSDNRVENLEWCTNRENISHSVEMGLIRCDCAPKGEDNGHAKLTVADVIEIRRLRERGEKIVAIGKRYGIRHTTVSQIANRKSWKHVA